MLCGSAGLCGGSASGKTTVANKIIEALDVPWVVLLSMDSFYKVMPVCVFCLYQFGNYYRLSVGLLKEEMIYVQRKSFSNLRSFSITDSK